MITVMEKTIQYVLENGPGMVVGEGVGSWSEDTF